MKFREYLHQVEHDPAAASLRPAVTQGEQLLFTADNAFRARYWNEFNPALREIQNGQYTFGDDVPLPYETYTGCFVWVAPVQTIDVGPEWLDWRYDSDIPITAIRDFVFKNAACPIPRSPLDVAGDAGLRLDLMLQHNGRWWRITSAGDTCSTTTTTTQPPCDCSTHPSMQFTISGVTLRPGAGACGNNDQICASMNRQWCLPFRGRSLGWWGGNKCEWKYTLSYNNGCPPGSLWYGPSSETSATLTWPFNKVFDPVSMSYVCPAELNFGMHRYVSYNFNPDTGGTFELPYGFSPWQPTCLGWPTTVTVTANANCDPDPPTTTTTTTTTGPPGP